MTSTGKTAERSGGARERWRELKKTIPPSRSRLFAVVLDFREFLSPFLFFPHDLSLAFIAKHVFQSHFPIFFCQNYPCVNSPPNCHLIRISRFSPHPFHLFTLHLRTIPLLPRVLTGNPPTICPVRGRPDVGFKEDPEGPDRKFHQRMVSLSGARFRRILATSSFLVHYFFFSLFYFYFIFLSIFFSFPFLLLSNVRHHLARNITF